jgi:hypothetical protein
VVTPLAVDLALILSIVNGQMDRDNLKPAIIGSGSTLDNNVANRTFYQTSSGTTSFDLQAPGRIYHTALDQTASRCLDGGLLIYANVNLRFGHQAAIAGTLAIAAEMGIEVEGKVIASTGYRVFIMPGNLGAAPNNYTDLPWSLVARCSVPAGDRRVRVFHDFKLCTPTLATAQIQADTCSRQEARCLVIAQRR